MKHKIVTRKQWLAARLKLLEAEKRAHAAQRRCCPATAKTAVGSNRQRVSI